jgi:ribosomal protein L37E
MKSYKGKKQWVCERCLTFTNNNKQCPTCGYTHLSKIKICLYTGRNKQNIPVKTG